MNWARKFEKQIGKKRNDYNNNRQKKLRIMETNSWKYFYLTDRANINQFEYDRRILRQKVFSDEAQDILLKLRNLRNNTSYDEDFMNWMTKDSLEWHISKEISEAALDHSLKDKSLVYLHSILGNLFSYYNFFSEHQHYHFIKHGYPLDINITLPRITPYIVFKEFEEIYETAIVSEADLIEKIVCNIRSQPLKFKMEKLRVTKDSIILLQYEND